MARAAVAERMPAVPALFDGLASMLPDVRVHRLPGGDHVEALASPERVVGRIAHFLADVDTARMRRAAA